MSIPGRIKKLYKLMYDMDELFFKYSIQYYVTAGTLLGAIRHKGIIPLDDSNLKVSMDKKKKKLLNSYNFIDDLTDCGYGLRTFPYGDNIYYLDDNEIALDVFYTRRIKNMFEYAYVQARKAWSREYITKSEMYPLKRVKFGTFEVTVPGDTRGILDRFYKNWNSKLSKEIRGPAKPITIKRKNCLKITSKHQMYFINCASHKDRLLSVKEQFSKEDIKALRVPCVNGKKYTEKSLCDMIDLGIVDISAEMSPIEVAISMSHIGVWERYLSESEAPYVFVFEDDIKLRKDFSTKVNQILANVPEFDILYLYNHNNFQTKQELRSVCKIKENLEIFEETVPHNAGGVAYILKRKFAEYLVSRAYPIKKPVDTFMGTITFSKRFKYYSVGAITEWSNNVVAIPKWTVKQTTQEKDSSFSYIGKLVKDFGCEKN